MSTVTAGPEDTGGGAPIVHSPVVTFTQPAKAKPGYKSTEFLTGIMVLAMGFYMMNWGPSIGAKEAGQSLIEWALTLFIGSRTVVKISNAVSTRTPS